MHKYMYISFLSTFSMCLFSFSSISSPKLALKLTSSCLHSLETLCSTRSRSCSHSSSVTFTATVPCRGAGSGDMSGTKPLPASARMNTIVKLQNSTKNLEYQVHVHRNVLKVTTHMHALVNKTDVISLASYISTHSNSSGSSRHHTWGIALHVCVLGKEYAQIHVVKVTALCSV